MCLHRRAQGKGRAVKSNAMQQDPTSESAVKAVVLYGEFESGIRARALLSRVAQHAGCEERLRSDYWRFDILSRPAVARESLAHAEDADIVLLVSGETSNPPAWLLEWLEAWAVNRQVRDAVLAAWCRGHGRSEPMPEGVAPLRELARRHGLEWLCAEEAGRDAA